MGLFSSKKKVVVNTTVQPVFSQVDLPNSPRTAVIDTTMFGGDVTARLMDELQQTIGMRGTASWLWAKDHYHYGTPVSNLAGNGQATATVIEVLKSLYGQGIHLDYCFMGPYNSVHYAWVQLMNNYGYSQATNQLSVLSVQKGTPVYLVDLVPRYTQATIDFLTEMDELHWLNVHAPYANAGVTLKNSAGNPSATPTPYTVLASGSTNSVVMHYEYLKNGVITAESLIINIPSDLEDADIHQARIVKGDGSVVYFAYEQGSGGYPSIDSKYQYDYADAGTYLPWVYFRYNFQNLATPALASSEAYKDSSHYCRYIGMDYQTMADSIYGDTNLSDVIQSMMIFGIRADASSAVEGEYLFRYFDMINSAIQQTTFGDSGTYAQLIQDKFFQMTFNFRAISKVQETGNKADPGKYGLPEVSGTTVSYFRQINATTYEKISIEYPTMRYRIQGKYGHSARLGQAEMLIPLDRAVFKEMSLVKREELLARGLHFMCNTYQEIKTKWYQSSLFQILLVVVAVAISIVSFGGFSAVSAALAAFAAAGATVILTTLAIAVIKMLVLQLAVKVFIDVVGLENSLFAAMLMVAASFFVPTTWAHSTQIAEGMLAAGNNMVKQVGTGYGKELENIQKEMAQFAADAQKQYEQLEEKRFKEFGLDSSLDALDFVTREPAVVFGELADAFLQRTVHSGNPGVHVITSTHDYVAQALSLPSQIDSMRNFATPIMA